MPRAHSTYAIITALCLISSNISLIRIRSCTEAKSYSTGLSLEFINRPETITSGIDEVENGPLSLEEDPHPIPIRPPTYLTLLYEVLQQKTSGGDEDEGSPAQIPALRAILPKQMDHGHLEVSKIVYRVSLPEIGMANSVKAIFTLKEGEHSLHYGAHMVVNAHCLDQQEKQAQRIKNSKDFYEFDLTDFLKTCSIRSSSSEIHQDSDVALLRLDVTVYTNNRRKQVSLQQIFEAENELPFILLAYKGNNPAPEWNLEEISGNSAGRKRKRSVETGESTSTSVPSLTSTTTTTNRKHGLKSVKSVRTAKRIPPYPPLQSLSTACHRQEWRVSPEDVDLLHVISPYSLNLGYCSGECPFPIENDFYNFTFHAYFLDKHRVLKAVDLPMNFPQSSCVPVSYEDVLVMVPEDNGFVVLRYRNGSVRDCGCR